MVKKTRWSDALQESLALGSNRANLRLFWKRGFGEFGVEFERFCKFGNVGGEGGMQWLQMGAAKSMRHEDVCRCFQCHGDLNQIREYMNFSCGLAV